MTAPTLENIDILADTAAITPSNNVSVGDCMALQGSYDGTSLSISQPTGGADGTWKKLIQAENTLGRNHTAIIWAKLAEPDDVGAEFTIDDTFGGNYTNAFLSWSGNDQTSIDDAIPDTPTHSAVEEAETANPNSFSPITTSVNDSYVVGMVTGERTTGSGAVDLVTSWGTLSAISGSAYASGGTGGRNGQSSGFIVDEVSGSQGGTATVDLQADEEIILVMYAVAPPSGGAPAPKTHRLLLGVG